MAYIHDSAVTTQASTTAATYAMNMPDHAVGDLLVWYASCDAGTLTPSGSVWTIIGANPTSSTTNIIVSAAGYRVATTTTETLSLATSDVASCIVVCFKEVDATVPFDGVAIDFTAVNTATSTPVSVALTSTTANALYVSMVAQAGANPMAVSGPGAMYEAISDAGGTTDTLSAHNAVAWQYKRTAGSVPVINWISNLSMQYTRLSFVLRSAAGSRIPPYIDRGVLVPAELVHLGSHLGTLNGSAPSTNGITATINGKTATPATATLLADSGVDPYASIITSAAAQTAATALVGPEITITTAKNATGKLLAGAVMAANWKQGRFGVGSLKQGGVVVRLGSGAAATTAWNAYQVSAKDAQVAPTTPTVFVIEPGYATTAYATGAGGNCLGTAVKYVQVLRNAPSFSSQVGLTECYLVDKQVVAGGDDAYPVGLDGMVAVGKSFRLPLIQKAGASSVVLFAPVQIGGGDAVNYQVDSGVIQFPKRASATAKDVQFHASDNRVGLYLAAKSGDVCKLTNSLITSPNPAVFEVVSAATAAATWDLSNNTFVGMTVTLRPVTTYSGEVFNNCPTVTTTGSVVTDSTFINSSIVVSSPANAALISACGISKTTGTAHGITITGAAANITLSGIVFTGYAAGNGSTGSEAIFVNIASGTMDIGISGGGTTPSIRTAGAIVSVISGATITVNNMVTGSRVRVTRDDTSAVLLNDVEVAGQVSFTTSYAGNFTVTVRKATSAPYYQEWVGGGTSSIGSTTLVKALQTLDQ